MNTNASVLNSIVTPVNLSQALNDAIGMYGYPSIGTDLALGTRTIFASIPYFIDGFVSSITGQLQAIVDQDIFVISALAGLTELAVQFLGDGFGRGDTGAGPGGRASDRVGRRTSRPIRRCLPRRRSPAVAARRSSGLTDTSSSPTG